MQIALSAVLLAAIASAQTTQPEPPKLRTLDVRYDAFIDMHFYVRAALATLPDDASPELRAAVAAAQRVEELIGAQRGWALIESAIANATNAELGVHVCTRLPEDFRTTDDEVRPLREPALALAMTYVALEPEFRQRIWPEHKQSIAAAQDRLTGQLGPHEAECFALISERLRMTLPTDTSVRVLLVAKAPAPGAFTQRRRGGGGVCFVAVDALRGAELHAATLREATRALDLTTHIQPTAFNMLRGRLQAAGLGPPSRAYRLAPYALAAAQADAVVGRFMAPGFQRETRLGDPLDEVVAQIHAPWSEYVKAGGDPGPALDTFVRALAAQAASQPAETSVDRDTVTEESP